MCHSKTACVTEVKGPILRKMAISVGKFTRFRCAEVSDLTPLGDRRMLGTVSLIRERVSSSRKAPDEFIPQASGFRTARPCGKACAGQPPSLKLRWFYCRRPRPGRATNNGVRVHRES